MLFYVVLFCVMSFNNFVYLSKLESCVPFIQITMAIWLLVEVECNSMHPAIVDTYADNYIAEHRTNGFCLFYHVFICFIRGVYIR